MESIYLGKQYFMTVYRQKKTKTLSQRTDHCPNTPLPPLGYGGTEYSVIG